MAAQTTVIENLIVRLGLDNAKYKKGFAESTKATEKFTRDAMGRLRNAQGKFVKETDNLRIALRKTNSSFGRAAINVAIYKKQLLAAGTGMKTLGRSMALRLTAPLVIFGGLAVRSFAKFDQAMTESTSIMKVTTLQMEQMREVSLSLSTVAAQGPEDLAKSYFFLASAGKNAAQSMALLPQVAKFATAGAFDMALATDLLTDAQSALGLATKNVAQDTTNMTRVADVLVKANTLANASVRQFSIALTSKAGAALKAYNKDVEEGVAVLAALADQGVKAELAGNALDRVIRLASKGALDNAKAHKRLGFEVFDASGKMRNFADIIGNLEQVLEGMSDKQRAAALDALGFQARVQGVILPLLGTSKAIREYEKQLRLAGGTTERVANKQMKSFSNRMKVVKNQITVASIGLGQSLAPAVETVGKAFAAAANSLSKMSDQQRTVLAAVLVLAAAMGPLLILSGSLVTTITGLSSAYAAYVVWSTAATTATWLATTAAIALKGALILGVVVAVAAVGKAIFEAMPAIKAYRKGLEEITKQGEEALAGLTGRRQQELQVAVSLAPQEAIKALKRLEDNSRTALVNEDTLLKEQRKRVAELEPTWRSAFQAGKAIFKVEQARLEIMEKGFRAQRKNLTEIEKAVANAQAKFDQTDIRLLNFDESTSSVEGLTQAENALATSIDAANSSLEEQALKSIAARAKTEELQAAIDKILGVKAEDEAVTAFKRVMQQDVGPIPIPEAVKQDRLEARFGRPDFRPVSPVIPRPDFVPKPQDQEIDPFFGPKEGQVEKPEEREARLRWLESIDRRLEEQNAIERFPLGLE